MLLLYIKMYENIKYDIFFIILNLGLFLPLIFLTNTLFTFFFILEVNALLIFYKFVLSKIWISKKYFKSNFYFISFSLKNYLGMIFFQFWSNFFSSIFLLLSIILYLYLFSTCEWLLLNYFILFYFSNLSFEDFFFFFIFYFYFFWYDISS